MLLNNNVKHNFHENIVLSAKSLKQETYCGSTNIYASLKFVVYLIWRTKT